MTGVAEKRGWACREAERDRARSWFASPAVVHYRWRGRGVVALFHEWPSCLFLADS